MVNEHKSDLEKLKILEIPIENNLIFKWGEEQLGRQDDIQMFQLTYLKNRKKVETARIFNILSFFGIGGLHRFYLGDYKLGFIHLLTLGIYMIGTLKDFRKIDQLVDNANIRIANKTMEAVKTYRNLS